MKAQFVYENLEFERGGDPKEALNIGRSRILKKIDDWITPSGAVQSYYKHFDDGDYEGCVIVIYQDINSSQDRYYSVIRYPNGSIRGTMWSHKSIEAAWREAKDTIDKEKFSIETGYWEAAGVDPPTYFNPIEESMEFERGKDPKASMGIGKAANPIKILSMDEEQWEGGRVMSNDDVEAANQNTWNAPLDDEHEIDFILNNWEEEIDPFYGFWIGDQDDPDWAHPMELEGEFVEYNGKSYYIPETNLFKTIADTSPQPS